MTHCYAVFCHTSDRCGTYSFSYLVALYKDEADAMIRVEEENEKEAKFNGSDEYSYEDWNIQ
jgi:hypothetical protein